MLGTEVEVPILDGKAMLKVPALTQTDTKFRLKVKGLPNFQRYGKGDQHVCVKLSNIWDLLCRHLFYITFVHLKYSFFIKEDTIKN